MAKAAAGGDGPDFLLVAAVGAMAFLALRSRAATAGVPMGTAAQLRPDYTAQRNIAYTQAAPAARGRNMSITWPRTMPSLGSMWA